MATVEKVRKGRKKRIDKKKLLEVLAYEVVNGKPIYYRGYKEVLKGKKQPEEVMGASAYHARLVAKITSWLDRVLGDEYVVMSGELGYTVEGGWRSLDIAVFRYEDVKDKLKSRSYIDVPPVLVVEIDTHGDVESEVGYITNKVKDLLESGVGKVIWIFTEVEKVLIAEEGKDWVIVDWDEDIELTENLKLNIKELIKRP